MALLLAFLVLAGALSGCGQRGEETAENTPPQDALPDGGAVSQPETWETFLKNLEGDDIALVDWLVDVENKPSGDEVAALLRAAAAHPADRDGTPPDGSSGVSWSLTVYIGDPGSESYDWDNALRLTAFSQEENLVEIRGGDHLPQGHAWVEDAPLYQLVRTMMDTPDGEIDQAAYELYKAEVDGYLADLPAYYSTIDADIHRELTRFSLEAESERLNAQLYLIGCVCIVDPPEKAGQLLAGGAYIDSQMRVAEDGNGAYNILVAVDGRAVGFTGWESLEYGSLDQFETKEELIETVERGRLWY